MNIESVKKNEPLHIGNKIQIVVLRVYPSGLVELGIIAPKNIPIYREEFLEYLKTLKVQLDSIKCD